MEDHNIITVIKSYYPIFNYILYDPILYEGYKIMDDQLNIKITRSNKYLTIGSTLFFNLFDEYIVTNIVKCIDGEEIPTTKLYYTDLLDITYTITFNKPIPYENVRLWLKREFSEVV